MNDRTETLTFSTARDRLLMYLLTGMVTLAVALLTWLCLKTMALSDQVIKMNERNLFYQEQMNSLTNTDNQQQLATMRLSVELKHLQIQAASHGWKEGAE